MKKYFTIIIIVFAAKIAHAQQFLEKAKIEASDKTASDLFGRSVTISGDYAVVGALQEDEDEEGLNTLNNAGAAYIYEKNTDGTWEQIQKIVASDRAAGDQFGYSVSISGDYLIVGASGKNTNTGAAYIFKRECCTTWIEVQKIEAGDKAIEDYFGFSVSISGGYAIVGAYQEDEDKNGANTLSAAGSAYIYKLQSGGNWTQEQKIVASDRQASDRFGISVAVNGENIVVGAYFEDHDASGGNTLSNAGSAYVFKRSTGGVWSQVQKIVASDRVSAAFFGWSVSINGDNIIVGAYGKSSEIGGAYIYKRAISGVWSEVKKIVVPAGGATPERYGYSVSISGDYAVAGAYQADAALADIGAVYVYKRGADESWDQFQKLNISNTIANDRLGYSVSIDGENIIAGTINKEAAYVFKLEIVTPVTTSDFIALEVKGTSLIRWKTESEVNNSHFVIERSFDGNIFKYLGEVVSESENEKAPINYQYTDKNPALGANYYRLAQTDKDGTTKIIGVKSVDIKDLSHNDIEIYPNPVVKELMISYKQLNIKKIILTDVKGVVIKQYKLTANDRLGNVSIDLDNLKSGVYLVNLIGDKTYVRKIVKQ